MSQKLNVSDFKWVEETSQFNKDFRKIYSEDSNVGYFIEAEKLHELLNDLPFLLEIMKIEKTEKLLANFHDKEEYVIHKRNIKQALNHRFVLKKVHKVIKFDQKNWLKSYTDMKTELRKNAKIIPKKIFSS